MDGGEMKAGLTTGEVERFKEAIANSKFRQCLVDYMDEISDPKQRQEQETYLCQLEAQGRTKKGYALVRPDPGFCVKLQCRQQNSNFLQKVFLNVCKSNGIREFSIEEQVLSLPFALGPLVPDKDSKGRPCMVVNVAIGLGSVRKAIESQVFLSTVVDSLTQQINNTTFKSLQGCAITSDFKLMKNLKCKGGKPSTLSVRLCDLTPDYLTEHAQRIYGLGKTTSQEIATPPPLEQALLNSDDETEHRSGATTTTTEQEIFNKKLGEEVQSSYKNQVTYTIVYQGEVSLSQCIHHQETNILGSSPDLLENVPKSIRVDVFIPEDVPKDSLQISYDSRVVTFSCSLSSCPLLIPLPLPVLDEEATACLSNCSEEGDSFRKVLKITFPVDLQVLAAERLRKRQQSMFSRDVDGEEETKEEDLYQDHEQEVKREDDLCKDYQEETKKEDVLAEAKLSCQLFRSTEKLIVLLSSSSAPFSVGSVLSVKTSRHGELVFSVGKDRLVAPNDAAEPLDVTRLSAHWLSGNLKSLRIDIPVKEKNSLIAATTEHEATGTVTLPPCALSIVQQQPPPELDNKHHQETQKIVAKEEDKNPHHHANDNKKCDKTKYGAALLLSVLATNKHKRLVEIVDPW